MKIYGNRLNAKHQEKEVEAVESPAEKSRQETMPLRLAQSLEIADDRHDGEHTRESPIFLAMALPGR